MKKAQNLFVYLALPGALLLLISCNQNKPQGAEENPSASEDSVELTSVNALKWVPKLEPNPHPDAQWFRQAAFGLFPCWGLASGTPNGEGLEIWVYSDEDGHGWRPPGQISAEKMAERAHVFNPKNYDPDRWMKAASAAGFRYAVLTARHVIAYYPGDSDYGDFHAGHYIGRDLLAPYVEACRNNNIKVGFYWMHWDWYHGWEYINYNYPWDTGPPFHNYKHEAVDYIPPMPDSVKEEVSRIANGQLRELLTKYGKIDLLWPDGNPEGFTVEELRRLQPGAIWGRGGEYATPETWYDMKMEWIKEANRRGYQWELCDVCQDGSWHWSEKAEKSGMGAAEMLSNLAKVRARGGNYLANISPSPDGEMPHWFYPLCEQLAGWMETGAEAIYDINTYGPFPYPDQCAQPVTVTSKAWYVFPETDPETFDQPIVITDVGKPASVRLLRNKAKVPYEFADGTLTLNIPREQRTDLPDVVKIKWKSRK